MIVYRITEDTWAGSLTASGKTARWNRNGSFVLYTAWSLELACLENLVHIGNIKQRRKYKTTVIEVPDSVAIKKLTAGTLKEGWSHSYYWEVSQGIAQNWLDENKYCILRVPSVIIPEAFNYLFNPAHKEFKKIKVKNVQPFVFDERLLKK